MKSEAGKAGTNRCRLPVYVCVATAIFGIEHMLFKDMSDFNPMRREAPRPVDEQAGGAGRAPHFPALARIARAGRFAAPAPGALHRAGHPVCGRRRFRERVETGADDEAQRGRRSGVERGFPDGSARGRAFGISGKFDKNR